MTKKERVLLLNFLSDLHLKMFEINRELSKLSENISSFVVMPPGNVKLNQREVITSLFPHLFKDQENP